MQQSQKTKGNMNLAGGSKGGSTPGGGKGFTKLLVGIVCAAAVGGFLWMKSPSSTVTTTGTQIIKIQTQPRSQIVEIHGQNEKYDLGATLAAYKSAKQGSMELQAFEEAQQYLQKNKGVIDQAIQETQGQIVVIGDTSLSMGSDLAKVGTVNAYLASLTAARPVTAIWVDDEVEGVEQLKPGYIGNPIGGGGTSFVPGFEYIEKNGIKPGLVIYITDGYCNSFPSNKPNYPVLWMIVGQESRFHAPWGVVAKP